MAKQNSDLVKQFHNTQKFKSMLTLNNIIDSKPDGNRELLTNQLVSDLLKNASTTMNEDIIFEGLKRKIHLSKAQDILRNFDSENKHKTKGKPFQLNKQLSAKERRALHIRKRKPDQVSYSDALIIWRHWCTYIEQMDWHEDKDGFNAQLNRLDMNGVCLRIVKAKNPSLVGMQGVVIMDRKCTFTMVTDKNTLKVIPKVGCVFEIFWTKPGTKSLELYGKYMCIRPEERANRKVRTTMVPVL